MITAGGLLWTFRVWCRGHHRAGKRFERCCLDFSKSKNFGQVRTELFRQGLIKMASAAVDADHFGLVGSLETDGAESEAKSKNQYCVFHSYGKYGYYRPNRRKIKQFPHYSSFTADKGPDVVKVYSPLMNPRHLPDLMFFWYSICNATRLLRTSASVRLLSASPM